MSEQDTKLMLPNYNPYDQAGDCVYDAEVAERACKFFSLFLKHDKGVWAGQPFDLLPYQTSIVSNIFGWLRPDGSRRFRSCLAELPRKTGKSHLCAGLALYLLTSDNEHGAEIVTTASSRDQASIVFGIAKRFVLNDEFLSKHCKIYRNSIVVESTGSVMKALSSDSGTAHGLSCSAIVMDELHVWTKPDAREFYEALVTSQGARKNPLNISITTAGTAEPTLWLDMHNYAKQVQENTIEAMDFLPALWGAEKDDAWDDPEVWKRVNPALGHTVQMEFYEQECAKAKALPSYQNSFKRLYLNQPTAQMNRWIDMNDYESCEERYSLEELKGRRCFAGVDLSSTLDLTALCLVFPRTSDEGGGYDVLPYFFVPEENMLKRQRDDNVPYMLWAEQGFITPTSGDIVDYEAIQLKINELSKDYNILSVVCDRWHATQFAIRCQEFGHNVAYIGQGYRSQSPACKELEAMIVGGRFRHGNHPVLRWNFSVVACEQDASGNLKISKRRSTERIDGVAGTLNAIAVANITPDEVDSVYESRDLEIL